MRQKIYTLKITQSCRWRLKKTQISRKTFCDHRLKHNVSKMSILFKVIYILIQSQKTSMAFFEELEKSTLKFMQYQETQERDLGKHRSVKLDLRLTPYIKINSKWIKHLNLTPETIKLLEGNFITLDLARVSWIGRQKHRQLKWKWDTLDYSKIKNICAPENTINRVRWQRTK